MFREMRRKRQQLSNDESIAILERLTSGVLALSGSEDYPYAVPISYVYHEGKLYFHSALKGHKIDLIRQAGKASFCVIEQDDVVPEEYTTYFRSVIAFGRIRIIEDEGEKRSAIECLAAKYSPHLPEGRKQEIDKSIHRMCMIEMDVEHMTGKESIELVRKA